jgi:hypothetical protein
LNDSTVRYTIKSLDDPNIVVASDELHLGSGANFINLSLKKNKNLKDKGNYQFQLNNSKKEEWSLKFRYVKNEKE